MSIPLPTKTAENIVVLARGARWLAVFKPSGILVHRGWARDGVILVDVVRDLVGARVHLLHRLDRATSGVVLFGLDPEVAALLQAGFTTGGVSKRYVALVRGTPPDQVVCHHPLTRGRSDTPSAKEKVPAETAVERLWTGEGELHSYSLVEAKPKTGRLHQIRRHLKHLNHPIIGDVKHGKGLHNRWFREHMDLRRLALHAAELSFVGPEGKRHHVLAPLPADLADPLTRFGVPAEVIERLGKGPVA